MKIDLVFALLGLADAYVPDCPDKCQCTLQESDVYVDCRNVGLTEIPKRQRFAHDSLADFFRFPPRTTYLDLSKNDIVFIDDLPGLPDLIFLNFTENNITDIHYDAFDRKSSIFQQSSMAY